MRRAQVLLPGLCTFFGMIGGNVLSIKLWGSCSPGWAWNGKIHYAQEQHRELALGFLVLSSALADFVTWIALANHVNATSTANHLAVRVTEFQSSNRGNNFHGSTPSNSYSNAVFYWEQAAIKRFCLLFRVPYSRALPQFRNTNFIGSSC
jgi:hypothetical protein